MQSICEYCETFELFDQVAATAEFKALIDLDENEDLTPELGATIATLWANPGICATWARRSRPRPACRAYLS